MAVLARPLSNTESAILECFLTIEWSLFGDSRVLVFSAEATDSVSMSDLRLFSSLSGSDLSMSPSMLSARDLESCNSPFTDGLSSRILPSESDPIDIVLSLHVLTRLLLVDFLFDALPITISETMQPV